MWQVIRFGEFPIAQSCNSRMSDIPYTQNNIYQSTMTVNDQMYNINTQCLQIPIVSIVCGLPRYSSSIIWCPTRGTIFRPVIVSKLCEWSTCSCRSFPSIAVCWQYKSIFQQCMHEILYLYKRILTLFTNAAQ